jgi:hypothetical protein
MSILGDATVVIARLDRATSNALRVQLTTPGDTELAHAQQKGGLAVLLGFKNGAKATTRCPAPSATNSLSRLVNPPPSHGRTHR